MLEFLTENIGTIVVGLLLLAAVVLILRKMRRDRKTGNVCGGGCPGCSGACGCCGQNEKTPEKNGRNP